jgi:hypothetical protein
MLTLKPFGCILLTLVLTSCRSITAEKIAGSQDALPCPPQIREQVKVAASAAALTIDRSAAPADNSANVVTGRRVVISFFPGAGAAGLHLVSNAVSVTTFGGTLEGMADPAWGEGVMTNSAHDRLRVTQISGARAIDVTPG